MANKETPWTPAAGLPGYVQRHNKHGYLETAPTMHVKHDTPEPLGPSVSQCLHLNKRHTRENPDDETVSTCRDCGYVIPPPCCQCARHEADAERLAKENRELKEELKLRNQEIEDLRITNRNLSQKIVNDRRNMRGIHGS